LLLYAVTTVAATAVAGGGKGYIMKKL